MTTPFVVTPRAAVTDAAPPARVGAPLVARSAPGFVVAAPARSVRPPHPALVELAPFIDDDVTDLFVNGAHGLYVDRGRGPAKAVQWRATEEEVRALAVGLISAGGRHLDDAAPAVDVRLDGGVRVHAVLAGVSVGGTSISIRIPRLHAPTLAELSAAGLCDDRQRSALVASVLRRDNLLITGAAGAGKTTLLNALLREAPANERLVTIEDVAELDPGHPHHVRLEARQANLEGAGGIGLSRLVREALRMRPDRLVVGECRGEEVRDLLTALNTGHDGGAGTLHANSLADVPSRLEALGALAGLDDRALARQAVSAFDRVVHVERRADGMRRIAGIAVFGLDAAGRLTVEGAP